MAWANASLRREAQLPPLPEQPTVGVFHEDDIHAGFTRPASGTRNHNKNNGSNTNSNRYRGDNTSKSRGIDSGHQANHICTDSIGGNSVSSGPNGQGNAVCGGGDSGGSNGNGSRGGMNVDDGGSDSFSSEGAPRSSSSLAVNGAAAEGDDGAHLQSLPFGEEAHPSQRHGGLGLDQCSNETF